MSDADALVQAGLAGTWCTGKKVGQKGATDHHSTPGESELTPAAVLCWRRSRGVWGREKDHFLNWFKRYICMVTFLKGDMAGKNPSGR